MPGELNPLTKRMKDILEIVDGCGALTTEEIEALADVTAADIVIGLGADPDRANEFVRTIEVARRQLRRTGSSVLRGQDDPKPVPWAL